MLLVQGGRGGGGVVLLGIFVKGVCRCSQNPDPISAQTTLFPVTIF